MIAILRVLVMIKRVLKSGRSLSRNYQDCIILCPKQERAGTSSEKSAIRNEK